VERQLALVPADRYGQGAVITMDVRENLHINPAQGWMQPINRNLEIEKTIGLLNDFDIRPRNPEAEFSTLSGGNAQKVVLARCLSSGPKVLVLEEPTAAVDIGARAEIHRRVRQIAASGRAVILVSSDLEEVEQVCDRALVMERGQIKGELKGQLVTAANLLEAAYGVDK
jgi:ribose transport system ATP-binding protein